MQADVGRCGKGDGKGEANGEEETRHSAHVMAVVAFFGNQRLCSDGQGLRKNCTGEGEKSGGQRELLDSSSEGWKAQKCYWSALGRHW